MTFCVSPYQVMRQHWLLRGLTPCPGTSWVRSCSCLGSNPKSLHKAGVGAGILLPSRSCWTLGVWHPPRLLMAQSPSLLSPCPAHGSQELCALGLLLLPSSHTPQPSERCQQPLVTILAGPKDSHTIRVHEGKGHSWLLLSHWKSSWSSSFLMISMSILVM